MATTMTPPATTQEKLLRAREASAKLLLLSTAQKNAVLMVMADAIEANAESIIAANKEDLDSSGLSGAMLDRLMLNPKRIKEMASGVRAVAKLTDPIDETLAEWTRPNGLRIRKVRVPLGVVGIIYESRPNVTVDTAVLAFKTSNAIVLRGGKEAAHSNQRLVEILNNVAGVPEGAIELLDSSTRESVGELIKARGLVDVIIPRGGQGLISYVVENSVGSGDRNRSRELPHLRGRVRRPRNGGPHRDQRQDTAPFSLQRRRKVAGARSHRRRVRSAESCKKLDGSSELKFAETRNRAAWLRTATSSPPSRRTGRKNICASAWR